MFKKLIPRRYNVPAMLTYGRFIKWVKPQSEGRWLDLVTLVVPRQLLLRTVPSFFKAIGDSGRNLRWVVHVDPVDGMMDGWQPCLDAVEELSRRFDAYDIAVAQSNQGHPRSMFSCFDRICHDSIYSEDDKLFTVPFNVDEIERRGFDYVCLGGRRGRMPCTRSGWWSLRSAKHIASSKGSYSRGNIERWIRGAFNAGGFTATRGSTCHSIDIGLDDIFRCGLVRAYNRDGSVGDRKSVV